MTKNSIKQDATVYSIAQLGDKILHKIALPVENIQSPANQKLLQVMLATVKHAGGVGIAAPQIYQSKRLFIMCSKPSARYPNAPDMEPCVIINPEILHTSTKIEKDWEGCLSVANLRGLVPRFQQIKVSYVDINNNRQQKTFEGFLARIFQHELDHLNGLTFVDRVESQNDLMNEKQWRKEILGESIGN